MYTSESSSPSRVTLALGLPSDRHRLLGGTVACVLFGEVVYQVGTSGLAQSLVPHFFARLIWTWVHPPDRHPLRDAARSHQSSLSCLRRPGRDAARSHQLGQADQLGQAGQASLTLMGVAGPSSAAQGSGAASGAQALHQQDQRSALARCRKTQFFLHALFFYISFYASPLVNAQFRACNQCRKESSPKSLGSLPCTLSFS